MWTFWTIMLPVQIKQQLWMSQQTPGQRWLRRSGTSVWLSSTSTRSDFAIWETPVNDRKMYWNDSYQDMGKVFVKAPCCPRLIDFHLVTGPWTFTDISRNPSACSQIPIQYNVDYSQCVPEHLESNCSASTKQFTEEMVGVNFYVTVYQHNTAQRASQRISSFMTPGSKSGPINQKLWNKEMFSELDR